jgi:hypothetical protein
MGATVYVASTTGSSTGTIRSWYGLTGPGQLRRVQAWAVGGVQASRPAIYLASTIGTATTGPTYVGSASLIDGHILNTATSGGWLPAAQWLTNPGPNPQTESLNSDPTHIMVVTGTTTTQTGAVAASMWDMEWAEGTGPTVGSGDNGIGTLQTLPIIIVFEAIGAATNTVNVGVNLFWQPLVES